MTGFMSSGNRTNGAAPAATGLRVSSSMAGKPRPIVGGVTRLAYTLLGQANMSKHGGGDSSGKGGGGGKGGGSEYYTVDMVHGICEGPIAGILGIYDQNGDFGPVSGAANIPARTPYLGTADQGVDALSTADGMPLAYTYTAYCIGGGMNIGDTTSANNENYVVQATNAYVIDGIPDTCPSLFVTDLLTNPTYGLGFPPDMLNPANTDGTNPSSMASYCRAAGLMISPALTDQRACSDIVQGILTAVNCSARWSGGLLTFVPFGDAPLSGNGYTYTPPTQPEYSFGDDDFIAKDGDPPILATIKDQSQVNNDIKIQYLDRGNAYNPEIAEAFDDALIQLYGRRSADPSQDNLFNLASAAQMSAQLQLGRQQIVNQYQTTVGPKYILLDVEDIVALTDEALGLFDSTVRIVEIQENDDKSLTLTVEDWLVGTGNAPIYGHTPKQGPSQNLNILPDGVNPPVIFEPPPALTNGIAQVWAGVSPPASGSANWGGCLVFVSTDGNTFKQLPGKISAAARQGFLSAELAAFTGSNPDNAHTLAVDVSESSGQLISSTTQAAQLGQTLCYVDGELLAFADATLETEFNYDLTGLERGMYGTTAGAHPADSVFLRLDDAIFSYDLPAEYVGVPLHFKFQSVNIFGALQPIDDCTVYGLTPTGVGYFVQPPSDVVVSSSSFTQADGTHIVILVVSWTASTDLLLDHYEVQISINAGASWSGSNVVGSDANSWRQSPASALTNYVGRVRAISNTGNQSTWATSESAETVALSVTVPAAPTGLAAQGGQNLVNLTWNPNPEPDILYYRLRATPSPSEVYADAAVIAEVKATSFSYVNLGYGVPYTFWLEAINVAGASLPAGPTHAITAFTIDIEGIGKAAIDQSMLAPLLEAKIASIDPIAVAMMQALPLIGSLGTQLVLEQANRETADTALRTQILLLTQFSGTNSATIEQEALERVAADSALAGLVTSLTVTVDSNNDTLTTAISAEQTARIDADTAISDQLTTMQSTLDGNSAAISAEATTRAAADGVSATQINALLAGSTADVVAVIEGLASVLTVAASLFVEQLARQTADEALAQQILSLSVTYTNGISTANAALALEQTVRATADSSLSQQILNLSASFTSSLGTTNAALASEQTTRANADTALGQRIDTVTATVTTNQTTNAAAISAEATARAAADSANATAIETVQAQSNANTAAISEQSTAIAGIDGTLSATWSLKTQAIGTHTAIAGIAIEADGGTGIGEVAIMATKLIVIGVDGSGNPVTVSPFFIQGGEVFIQQAVIGTIAANMLTTGDIRDQNISIFGGFNLYNADGSELIIDTAGIRKLVAGAASNTYSASVGSGNTSDSSVFETIVFKSFTQEGGVAMVTAWLYAPTSGDGGVSYAVIARLLIDGNTVVQDIGSNPTGYVQFSWLISDLGDHEVELQILNPDPSGGTSTADYLSASIVIEDRLA